MSRFGQLVKREVDARKDIIGLVLSQRELKNREAAGAPMWVCRVDVGGSRILEDIPIRSVNGNRFYAERGASVLLRREANGRLYIIGPVSRTVGIVDKRTYTLGNTTPVTTKDLGFTTEPVAFEFYEGTGTGSGSFWNDGVNPFPLVQIKNAQGVVV